MSELTDTHCAQATTETILADILTLLAENKAEDVVSIDLTGRTEIADNMIIASGHSTRQVKALAENLVRFLKEKHGQAAHAEGLERAEWILVSTSDVIVHIFRPEVRAFYQIEKMWQMD